MEEEGDEGGGGGKGRGSALGEGSLSREGQSLMLL